MAQQPIVIINMLTLCNATVACFSVLMVAFYIVQLVRCNDEFKKSAGGEGLGVPLPGDEV